MKILHLAAEVAPYASVGGLSQVMFYLPRSLRKLGHDIRIFTPRYGLANDYLKNPKCPTPLTDVANLMVSTGSSIEAGVDAISDIVCSVLRLEHRECDGVAYLLVNDEYFGLRANVFGYGDDHVRFNLMARGCATWLLEQRRRLDRGDKTAWWPDVIHCHDWHAAYFIDLARRDPQFADAFRQTPLLLTVHNFKYQGNNDFRYLPAERRDNGDVAPAALNSPELQGQNALLRGIRYADGVSTVSPTHAREVLTEEYAEGLLPTLQHARSKMTGILNGIDISEFDPATDAIIAKSFSRRSFTGARPANKFDLQQEFSLPIGAENFLMAYVGRLSSQKGLDLLVESAAHLLENDERCQLVMVGTGEDRYREMLADLLRRFPKQVGLYLMSDFRLPRKLFAGADVMLIPSMFEPGGIVALEALRFGAVPLVRRTGGLNDSVTEFDPLTGEGNGFSFTNKDAWAMHAALVQARTIFRQPKLWNRLVSNCLASDFSWDRAAVAYDAWYERMARVAHVDTAPRKRRCLSLKGLLLHGKNS